MAQSSTRLSWPDQAKGFGILLVVIGHVWRGLVPAGVLPEGALFQVVDRLIYAFHMPLFFFLSGLFFETALQRPLGAFLRSRLVHVLWPLVLWTWIFFGFKVLIGGLANHPVDWAEFPILPLPPREQFWFFWALFLIQVLVWSVLHPLRRHLGTGVVLVVCLAALGLRLVPVPSPAYLGPALHFCIYFCAGLLALPVLQGLGGRMPPALGPGLFLCSEALALTGAVPELLTAFGAIFGIVLVFHARDTGGRIAQGLTVLGQASAAIYVAHVLFSAALRIGLVKLGVTFWPLHLVLGTVLGVLGPLVLWRVARQRGWAVRLGLPGS